MMMTMTVDDNDEWILMATYLLTKVAFVVIIIIIIIITITNIVITLIYINIFSRSTVALKAQTTPDLHLSPLAPKDTQAKVEKAKIQSKIAISMRTPRYLKTSHHITWVTDLGFNPSMVKVVGCLSYCNKWRVITISYLSNNKLHV